MWRTLFTTAICLFAFGSELVLDGSTSFIRAGAIEKIGQLVISSTDPIENNELPQPASPEVPDWAKTPSPSHVASVSVPVLFHTALLIFKRVSMAEPLYQEPHPLLFQRPPIAMT